MEFYDVINSRQSIREYDQTKKVDIEVLKRIINAGRVAPSACNLQPWKFIVVSSEEMLKKIRPCYLASWFKEAPHILIVKGYRSRAWVRGYDEYNSLETDLTIAMDHLILAAENEGVATCWIVAYNPEVIERALNLSDDEYVFAITPLGYPKRGYVKQIKQRKDFGEVVEFI